MTRVLVTGGAGFIGSHLTERLVSQGHEVVVLDDLSQGRAENLSAVAGRVKLIRGSYGDRKLAREALDGVDTVYHFAALLGVKRVLEDPWSVLQVDVADQHVFFDEIRQSSAKKIVFASSSEVYGEPERMPMAETDGLRPVTPYQGAKVMGEIYTRALHEQNGIDGVSLRFFNVFGPRQESSPYGFVASIFLANAAASRPHTIYGDGKQTRDFTYMDDTIDGVLLAAKAPGKGRVFNLGTGRETSVLDLARAVEKVTGVRAGIHFAPERPHEIHRRACDSTLARKELGFSPKVALDEGLQRTWNAMRKTE